MEKKPTKRVSDLRAHETNPRQMSAPDQENLGASLEEHGDLGGIILNVRFNRLVGGHQRSSRLNAKSKIVIEKTYNPPTRAGTVAEGYIEDRGERFSYREVDWDEDQESSAMIAANKHSGKWDSAMLAEHVNRLFKRGRNLKVTGLHRDEIDLMLEEARKKAATAIASVQAMTVHAPPAWSMPAAAPAGTPAPLPPPLAAAPDAPVPPPVPAAQGASAFDQIEEKQEIEGKRNLVIINCPTKDTRDALKAKLRASGLLEEFGVTIF